MSAERQEVIAGDVVRVGFIDVRGTCGGPVFVQEAKIVIMRPDGRKDTFEGMPAPYVTIETDEQSIGEWAYSGWGKANGERTSISGTFKVVPDPCTTPQRPSIKPETTQGTPVPPTLRWEMSDWVFDGEDECEEGVIIEATKKGLSTPYGRIPWSEIEAARQYFRRDKQ